MSVVEEAVAERLEGDRPGRVRAALAAMGLPADARAERLAPEQWRELYERVR